MNNSTYVKYNGGTDSYIGCSNPSALVKGEVYRMVDVEVHDYQTNIILEGVEGKFNSVWFNPLPTYLGFAEKHPQVGRTLHVERMQRVKDYKGITRVIPNSYYTTPVRVVEILGPATYKVVTNNTVYIVQVL